MTEIVIKTKEEIEFLQKTIHEITEHETVQSYLDLIKKAEKAIKHNDEDEIKKHYYDIVNLKKCQ